MMHPFSTFGRDNESQMREHRLIFEESNKLLPPAEPEETTNVDPRDARLAKLEARLAKQDKELVTVRAEVKTLRDAEARRTAIIAELRERIVVNGFRPELQENGGYSGNYPLPQGARTAMASHTPYRRPPTLAELKRFHNHNPTAAHFGQSFNSQRNIPNPVNWSDAAMAQHIQNSEGTTYKTGENSVYIHKDVRANKRKISSSDMANHHAGRIAHDIFQNGKYDHLSDNPAAQEAVEQYQDLISRPGANDRTVRYHHLATLRTRLDTIDKQQQGLAEYGNIPFNEDGVITHIKLWNDRDKRVMIRTPRDEFGMSQTIKLSPSKRSIFDNSSEAQKMKNWGITYKVKRMAPGSTTNYDATGVSLSFTREGTYHVDGRDIVVGEAATEKKQEIESKHALQDALGITQPIDTTSAGGPIQNLYITKNNTGPVTQINVENMEVGDRKDPNSDIMVYRDDAGEMRIAFFGSGTFSVVSSFLNGTQKNLGSCRVSGQGKAGEEVDLDSLIEIPTGNVDEGVPEPPPPGEETEKPATIPGILKNFNADTSIKPGEPRYERLMEMIDKKLQGRISSQTHSMEVANVGEEGRNEVSSYQVKIWTRPTTINEDGNAVVENIAEISFDLTGKILHCFEKMDSKKAEDLFRENKFDELLVYLEKIMDAKTGNAIDPEAPNLYAYAISQMPHPTQEQKDRALVVINRAIEIGSGDLGYEDTKACILAISGKYDEAAKIWGRIIPELKININKEGETNAAKLTTQLKEINENFDKYKKINESNSPPPIPTGEADKDEDVPMPKGEDLIIDPKAPEEVKKNFQQEKGTLKPDITKITTNSIGFRKHGNDVFFNTYATDSNIWNKINDINTSYILEKDNSFKEVTVAMQGTLTNTIYKGKDGNQYFDYYGKLMVEKDGIYQSENGKSCFKIDATGTLIECDQSGKSLAEEKKKETDAEKDEKLEERTKNINKIFTDLQSKFPEGTKVEIPDYQEPDFRQWQLTRGDQSCRLKIGSDIPGELSIEVSQRLREGNVLNQFFPKYTFTLNDTNKVIQKINNYLLTDAEKGKDDLGAKMPALSDILQRDLTNADQEALNSMQTEIQKLEPDQIIILLEKLEVKKSQLQWASQMYIDIIEKNQEKDIRLLLLYLVANHETPMGDGINVAKVKAEIGRFCTEKPTDISVRYLGAKCFLIIQEKDAAIKLLKEGLVLKSAACGIGLCQLLKEDNLDEAKTALDQAKQYSPSDKEAEEIKKLESEINEKKERVKNINKIFTNLQPRFPKGTVFVEQNDPYAQLIRWELTRGGQSCWLDIDIAIDGSVIMNVIVKRDKGRFAISYVNETDKVIKKIEEHLLAADEREKDTDPLEEKMKGFKARVEELSKQPIEAVSLKEINNLREEISNETISRPEARSDDQKLDGLLSILKSLNDLAKSKYSNILQEINKQGGKYSFENFREIVFAGEGAKQIEVDLMYQLLDKKIQIALITNKKGTKDFRVQTQKVGEENFRISMINSGLEQDDTGRFEVVDPAWIIPIIELGRQAEPVDLGEKAEYEYMKGLFSTTLSPETLKIYLKNTEGRKTVDTTKKTWRSEFLEYLDKEYKVDKTKKSEQEKGDSVTPLPIPPGKDETGDEDPPMPRDPNKSTEKTLSTEVATRLLKENPVFIDLSSVTEPLSAEVAEIIASKGTKVALNGLTSMTPEIAKILPNLAELSLNGLTELPSDLATALGEFTGYKLSLDGLTSLNADQATALSEIPHDLSLNGLSSLESDVVKIFKEAGTFLSLNGIKELTPTLIADFEKYDSCLSFGGLTFLTESEARGLVAMNSYLSLNGINVAFLTPNVARELAKNNSSLELNGLTSLPGGVAAELKNLKTDVSLSLSKLDTISAEDARFLASVSRPSLNLGITSLDENAATALAPFAGEYLGLDNLTEKTLTPEVLRHFKDFKGGQLSLEGLESISIDLANALVEIPGTVILTGITDVSDDIGKILAKKGESLYMSDHMSEEKRTQYKFGGGGSFF